MEKIQVKVEQVATWVGLFTAVAGAAANYGITENKVATLEQRMSELYNVEEIRVLERRLTTLEVSLDNVKAAVDQTNKSIGGIEVTDTSEIQSRTSVNQSRIRALQNQVERIEAAIQQIRQKLDRLNSSPL